MKKTYKIIGSVSLMGAILFAGSRYFFNRAGAAEQSQLKLGSIFVPQCSISTSPSVTDIYNCLVKNYSEYNNITFEQPSTNLLRNGASGDWLLQTPNISNVDPAMGYNLADYAQVFCDGNGRRSFSGATPCDPCFNLPTCNTQTDCNAPAGFPVTCEVPNFLATNSLAHCTGVGGEQPLPAGTQLCMSNAQTILTDLYTAIVNAKFSIDITDLNSGRPFLTFQTFTAVPLPNPDVPDAFFFLFKKALTDLANTAQNPITVRLLGGSYAGSQRVGGEPETHAFLNALTADFPKKNKLTIVAVPERSCPDAYYYPNYCSNPYSQLASDFSDYQFSASWNHGKNVVVDKQILFTGGEDFWGGDYFNANSSHTGPVNDSMIRIEGPVAQGASTYINTLFGYLSSLSIVNLGIYSDQCWVYTNNKVLTSAQNPCAAKWITVSGSPGALTPQSADYSVQAMSVGKLNALANYKTPSGVTLNTNADQSEPARVYAISNAKQTVRIAQQGLFSVGKVSSGGNSTNYWPANPTCGTNPNPSDTMDAIVSVFSNNVINSNATDVYIITSFYTTGDGYGSDVDFGYVYNYICQSLLKQGIASSVATTQLQNHLNVGYFSYKNQSTQFEGAGHHNKFWMVDDHLFYFGSHNFYPTALQQFGVITDSTEAGAVVKSQFWDHLWSNADKSQFDPSTMTCVANTPVMSNPNPYPSCPTVQ